MQGLQRQLSQLQREARRQGKDQQLCGLTSRAQLVCVAVYILSGFHKEPAEAFLRDARKKRKRRLGDDILAADVPSQISKWFLELPFERLCQLQLPESEKDKAVHNDAVKYLAKWNTAVWVTRQNYDCGVAPTYDKLVQKYYEELEQRSLGHLGHQLRTSAEGRDGKSVFAKLDWALAINKAATQFLCSRRWVHVFQRCGVIGDRAGLRGPLASVAAKYLEVAPAAVAPSPDVIASLLPRNRAVCYHDLLPEH